MHPLGVSATKELQRRPPPARRPSPGEHREPAV